MRAALNTAKNCLTCKLADWDKTASGRLHPSGGGRCAWKMPTIVLPMSFYYIGYSGGGVPGPSGGGYINRKTVTGECPTWTPVL